MEALWYYVLDGKQIGPVSFEELKSTASSGQIALGDLVWQEGTADWVPARSVPGLFAGPPAPPPRPSHPLAEALPMDEGSSVKLAEPPGLNYIAGKSRAGEIFELAKLFLKRVSAPNPATIAPYAVEEDDLNRAGITDPTARKYAIWRRSVLWVAVVPTAFAALFGFINAIGTKTEMLSGFGILIVYLQALVFFALPASAVMGALVYNRPRDSARWVLLGTLVTIGFPLLVAFIPVTWLVTGSFEEMESRSLRAVYGVAMYLMILPMVLALLPAVSRACVRIKAFLPQSLVPGWGLVSSVPLFVLLTLASVVLLYQTVGNVLLILALILWIGAPLFYLTKFRLLTRPLNSKADIDALGRTQTGVLLILAGGILLLIIFLFDAKVIGTNNETSAFRPWSLTLHTKWIEYIGRSLFMTVLFADLLVWISHLVWREEKAFVGSEAAAGFDRTMTGLAGSLGLKQAEPAAPKP